MKTTSSFITLFVITVLACASCVSVTVVPSAIPATLYPDAQLPVATVTPEVFIALTQAVPAQIQLNGIVLVVKGARLGACDLYNCPAAPDETRYLAVTLQAQNLSSNQFLDYKNLPQGIAIHDNTGAMTTLNRLAKYVPELQQLTLYFTVPQAATVFGLQWPGAAEIPLTVIVIAEPTILPTSSGLTNTFEGITLTVPDAIATGANGGE